MGGDDDLEPMLTSPKTLINIIAHKSHPAPTCANHVSKGRGSTNGTFRTPRRYSNIGGGKGAEMDGIDTGGDGWMGTKIEGGRDSLVEGDDPAEGMGDMASGEVASAWGDESGGKVDATAKRDPQATPLKMHPPLAQGVEVVVVVVFRPVVRIG